MNGVGLAVEKLIFRHCKRLPALPWLDMGVVVLLMSAVCTCLYLCISPYTCAVRPVTHL